MRINLWRRLTCCTSAFLALAAMMTPTLGMSQTNSNSRKPESVSNRYLIVVETSSAMRKRGNGILETVNALIMNGMKGQMRSGDTLGIWTYSDKLHAGEFPLQTWKPENRKKVAENANYFIKGAKFEKKSRLDMVLPAVQELVRNSDYLTVLFLTDGTGKFNGTPFDKEINDSFVTWKAEQERKQMPFLTVLRATKGVITHHGVVPVPWTWEMPPLPPDLVAAWNVVRNQVEALTNKPPPATGKPLIVTGKKPAPAPEKEIRTENPAPAISNATPTAATQPKPQITAETNQTKTLAPTVAATTTKPATTAETPTPVQPTRANPSPQVSSTAQPQPATIGETAPPQIPSPKPQLPPAPGSDQKSQVPPQASSLQLAQNNPSAASAKTPGRTVESSAVEQPTKATPEDALPRATQQGALVPPPTIWENEWVWVGIGIVTLGMVIVGFLMSRRSRPASRISLITSSYDRTDKP